MSSKNHTAFT